MITEGTINAIGNGDAVRIGREVMIKDSHRFATPSANGLMEPADQIAALGVDADYGQSFGGIVSAPSYGVTELRISSRGIITHVSTDWQIAISGFACKFPNFF